MSALALLLRFVAPFPVEGVGDDDEADEADEEEEAEEEEEDGDDDEDELYGVSDATVMPAVSSALRGSLS